MGQSQSQKLTDEEKAKQDAENFVNDTRFISWDDKGNLRYGLVHPVKRLQQKLEILQMDFVDDEDGKLWYIMDSAWIASWLAYVHFDMQVAPAPGPCYNHRLITYDYADKRYTFRFAMQMAIQDRGGDYRRVSPEVWAKFKEFYPQSGPAITMVFNAKEKRNDGFYDPAMFTIVDLVEPPADANDEEKANKKKKRKLLLFKKKKEAEEKAAKEQAEKEAKMKRNQDKNNSPNDENKDDENYDSISSRVRESERPSNRLKDSDDDSDAETPLTSTSRRNRKQSSSTSKPTAAATAALKDSDDDSDDEYAPQNSLASMMNNNNNNNNNDSTSKKPNANVPKTSTKVVLKTSMLAGGNTAAASASNSTHAAATSARVTESIGANETKDDAYYEKIYLS